LQPARTRLRALVVAALAIAISGTTATAAHAAPSTSDLKKQITAAQNKLEVVTEQYNKMNEQLKQTQTDEKTLEASLKPAQAALVVAGGKVNAMAASAYMTGQVGSMNVILDGPDGLLDKMIYLDQISRDRQRDIDTYTATTQNFTTRQAALKTAQQKQAAQLKVINATKKDIESKIKTLNGQLTQAYGSVTGGNDPTYSGPVPNISGSAGVAVRFAFNQIGKDYLYATAGPDTYDCSGLTMAAWAAAGKSLPHNAAEQYSATARVSRSALKAGDLVFYSGLAHVGIYVGSGMIIDAPHLHAQVNERTINIESIYGYGRVT
jgi:cell wall-associated NlpC family hydrolase